MAQLVPARAGHHGIGGTTAAEGRLSVSPLRGATAFARFVVLAAVTGGIGAGCFGAVVVLTTLAAGSFDSRLTWDAAESGGDALENEAAP